MWGVVKWGDVEEERDVYVQQGSLLSKSYMKIVNIFWKYEKKGRNVSKQK